MLNNYAGKKIINSLCIIASIAVVLPLLILGYFNYPSADDWNLGRLTYHALQNGGSIWDMLKEAFRMILLCREDGEPRYAAVFFGTLQPGIFGEHFYRITSWIMIGSLFISELIVGCYFLGKGKKWILPIVIPSILIQILCVPFPVETFYWYTGSVNYTFVFSLSLILLVCFMKLKEGVFGRKKTCILIVLGSVLALIIGGNNYATSLSSVCFLGVMSFQMFIKDKKAFCRTIPITLLSGIGLLICLVAPANELRLEQEFGGSTMSEFYAVAMSLIRTGTNIFSWSTLLIFMMIVMVIPFLWMALRENRYSFRYPFLFTGFTFGIYASQITATLYVNGTTGGCRMADILYYAYHVWMLMNVGYWIGWLQRKIKLKGILLCFGHWIRKNIVIWFCICGVIIVSFLGIFCRKSLSTYRACAWLLKGDAQAYAQEWEKRLNVLHDDTVQEVYFHPLPGDGDMIFYTDFQEGENWVNKACAEYYGKDYVGLVVE